MSVLQKILKLFVAYLLISLVVAIIDVCRTFINVIKQGTDRDIEEYDKIFSIKNYIFFPSILIYAFIFFLITKLEEAISKKL